MTLTRKSRLTTVTMTVGDALRRHGIQAVLTGGACAALHSAGAYHSADVDFVLSKSTTQRELDQAMRAVDFERRGDYYRHRVVQFYVEFLPGPLAIGGDLLIRPVTYTGGRSRMLVLSPTDSCRDRLAAFYHWNDRQSFEAAVLIALRNRLRMAQIRRWSDAEGSLARFEEFESALRAARARRRR